jgi:hypothetical protein
MPCRRSGMNSLLKTSRPSSWTGGSGSLGSLTITDSIIFHQATWSAIALTGVEKFGCSQDFLNPLYISMSQRSSVFLSLFEYASIYFHSFRYLSLDCYLFQYFSRYFHMLPYHVVAKRDIRAVSIRFFSRWIHRKLDPATANMNSKNEPIGTKVSFSVPFSLRAKSRRAGSSNQRWHA